MSGTLSAHWVDATGGAKVLALEMAEATNCTHETTK